MANLEGYRHWLSNLKSQPAFVNNQYCARLAYEMEDKPLDGFKIPYNIVEEELKKEDKNLFLTNKENAYASPALRHWLVYLLKAYNAKTDINNFEEVLRDFLTKSKVRPTTIAHPLPRNNFFHNLPAECKLWIFHVLRTYTNHRSTLNKVATDALGNEYFIVPGCRLYVSIKDPLNNTLPIDEAKITGQPWEALYRFLYAQRYVQLCENQIEWKLVCDVLHNLKLHEVLYSFWPNMMDEFELHESVKITRDMERMNFKERLAKLDPIPSAAEWEKLKEKRLKAKKIATDIASKNVDNLQNGIERMQVTEQVPPNPSAAQPNAPQIWRGKCWDFPQCKRNDRCAYSHPKVVCNNQPNCPWGWNCPLFHDPCPNDGNCFDTECPNEHWQSVPTFHRKVRDRIEADPRPVATVPPIRRAPKKTSTDNSAPAPQAAPVQEAVVTPADKKRCRYFPKCTKAHVGQYFHPIEKCRKHDAGEPCAGQQCPFLHGACPVDGACEDMQCIYEHWKSPLVIERLAMQKRQQQQQSQPQGMTRTVSTSNLSTCSGRSTGRRKSVSFDFDETDQPTPPKKNSTSQKPVGILRPPANAQSVCRFRTHCTNKTCGYAHPTKTCPVFPKCPNGGACFYLHEACKQDGVCTNANCDAEHRMQRPMANNWCKNGSRCMMEGCKFLHPQECIGQCPTKDNCWKYHPPGRPAPIAAPEHRPPVPPRRTAPPPPTPAPRQTAPAPAQRGAHGPLGPVPGPGYYHGVPTYQFPQYPPGAYPPFPPGPGPYGPYPGYGPYGPGPGYGYPQGPGGYHDAPLQPAGPSPHPPYPTRERSRTDSDPKTTRF